MSEVVSPVLMMGGGWGMEWWAQYKVKNGGRTRVKSTNQLWKDCAGSLMADIKQFKITTYMRVRITNTGYCQPRLSPLPEIAIGVFHITMKPPPASS